MKHPGKINIIFQLFDVVCVVKNIIRTHKEKVMVSVNFKQFGELSEHSII